MQQTTVGPVSPEVNFGLAVSMLRNARHLSQRDFASRLTEKGMAVDASAVSRIEKGTRSIRLVEALTIAEVLDVELDFLISGSKTPTQEFRTIRKRLDHSLRQLREPIAAAAYDLWAADYHLREHPELLTELGDPDLGSPTDVNEYLGWIAKRVAKWQVVEDDFVRTESQEETDAMFNVFMQLIALHIGVPDDDEADNGIDQEAL
ncbi:helix-turn-helix domain-containing protein [Arthrobacter sp. PAMC 25486]|uniref:helix-turn-helix domain-containing protein n=1 Tax=Arthrobacter sp. PAMC 25486 TaxID=1494608 RepID=UPI0012FEFE9B|nr:helix-turn-helix transcriptional regulator [Arthrobacter sp. PAMC 25486]